MKKIVLLLLFSYALVFAQWHPKWSSNSINYNTVSGFFQFMKVNDKWVYKFYTVDSTKFYIMDSPFSMNPMYTYYFTPEEKLAGGYIYSVGVDLTGDNKKDFYVLSYYGSSPYYRQAIKILDITTGVVLFQLNNPNYYYSAPSIFDVDGDGYYECVVSRFNYPNFDSYVVEVYNTGVQTGKVENSPPEQLKFELKQNFPNPFNPETNIRYSINASGKVRINIFNSNGELVNTLYNDHQDPGNYEIVWDGTNASGLRLPSGVYFYELQHNDNKQVKKMLLLK